VFQNATCASTRPFAGRSSAVHRVFRADRRDRQLEMEGNGMTLARPWWLRSE
jgi:hypothetical protein